MGRLGYVEFDSDTSPMIITGNASGHDGTLEYSIDNGIWTEWDSSGISGYNIKIRGRNNTMLTGPEGQSGRSGWSIKEADVSIRGYISDLLDYVNMPTAPLRHPAFAKLFSEQESIYKCEELVIDITGYKACAYMFYGCTWLRAIPKITATILGEYCYYSMFQFCSLKISETQDDEYKYPILFAPAGALTADSWNSSMLTFTRGTFTGDPEIGVTYYTTYKYEPPTPPPTTTNKLKFNGQTPKLVKYNGQSCKLYYNGTLIYGEEPSNPQWIFGVEGLNDSTPQLTRTDDAVGKTWSYVGDEFGSAIQTDFDEIFNFERVTDADGNEFVRIPKMYRKFTGGDTLQMANYKADGFECYPIFKNEAGEEMDYYDHGCYKGSVSDGKLQSKSGVRFTGAAPIRLFEHYATKNSATGYRYQQNDIHALTLIWDLFQIVFATRNTEDVMGQSWKECYGTIYCGDTDTITNDNLPNPKSICGKKTGLGGFKFFGMEDIMGYAKECIDGIYFNGSSIYISYVPSQYGDSTIKKIKLSYSRPASGGYTSKLGYDVSNPFINYPVETNGSSTTYYTDYVDYSSSGTVLFQGGDQFFASYGLFNCDTDCGSEDYSSNRGARLLRRPI